MDLIAQIKDKLKGNEELLGQITPILDKIGVINTQLAKDVDIAGDKLKEAITGRDKAKENLKGVREKVGVADGEEFSIDSLDEFINNSKSADVKAIEAKFAEQLQNSSSAKKELEQSYKAQLQSKDDEINKGHLNLELYKVSGDYTSAKNANGDIITNLKDGAKIVDGVVKYFNQDGTVLRNSDGVEATLKDKIAILQDEKPFLFAPNHKPTGYTGGQTGGSGSKGGTPTSSFDAMMANKAKELQYGR